MKRFIVAAAIVGVLATALAGLATTAFAAPQAQGFGPGMGMHTPGTGMGQRGGAPAWAGQPDEVAKQLGLTQAEIQAQRLTGKSLAEIAAAAPKQMTKDTLVSTILSARKAILDKLVADGKLDKAQADYMYSRMDSQVNTMVDRKTTGPAWRTGTNTGTRPGMGMGGRWNR
jgi:hypothetical protein